MLSESDGEDGRSRSDKRARAQAAGSNAEVAPSQHGEEGYQETLDRAAKVQENITLALQTAGQSPG